MNAFTFTVLCILCRIEFLYTNSVGLDQVPRCVASELGTTLFAHVPKIGFLSIKRIKYIQQKDHMWNTAWPIP